MSFAVAEKHIMKLNINNWTEQRPGHWITKDSDGYVLRVRSKGGDWLWTVRPPGGGYDVYSGQAPELALAQQQAEAALQGLMDEISRIHDERIRDMRKR